MICPYDSYELRQTSERCEKCNRTVEEIHKSIQERNFPKPESVRIASITALVVGIVTLLQGLIALRSRPFSGLLSVYMQTIPTESRPSLDFCSVAHFWSSPFWISFCPRN